VLSKKDVIYSRYSSDMQRTDSCADQERSVRTGLAQAGINATEAKAVVRLAELNEKFGFKEGQKPRGPRTNSAEVYPRSPLGGLLVCGQCGARMWQSHSNTRRYYACPSAKKGCCDMTTQVPADRAEHGLVEFLLNVLGNWPDWMQTLYRLTCEAILAAAVRVPEDRDRDTRRAAELERQIENLVNALASSGLTSPAIAHRLREAETEKATVDTRLASYAKFDAAKVELPDEAWVAARLSEWAVRNASNDGPESLLHLALETVVAESVIAPGKKRGFIRLRSPAKCLGHPRCCRGRLPSRRCPRSPAKARAF